MSRIGKLKIDCEKNKKFFSKIANAVYTSLNQTDNLKAELVYMQAEEMRQLNKQSRGVDSVTDVLSFPTLDGVRDSVLKANEHVYELDGKYLFIGSIVLCEDKIKEQANELGHSLERETIYLTVHGLMHLFGHDHIKDEDKKIMREREKSALKLLEIYE